MPQDLQELLGSYQPKPLGEERNYAVFLPLVWSEDQWQLLYEVRSEAISQPGEVSFPGGGVEEGETAQEAAIREVVEELAIPASQVQLLGEIDYMVVGRSTIRCFVGCLDLDWTQLEPNAEVARFFTVPLATLMEQEPTYHPLQVSIEPDQDFPFERIRGGQAYPFSHHKRSIPFYDHLAENLWGMTAQFTHRFVEIIKAGQLDC